LEIFKMNQNDDWNQYDHDPRARKVRKTLDRKHKSRRRHDEKQHLKDIVDNLNSGRKDFYYDEYQDNDN